jgi:superfamily II DNA or RNA helicase
MLATINPRPYQVEMGRAFVSLLDKNPAARAICSLPTGCGKTIAGLMLHEATKSRTLWLAHRDELITQPAAAARALMPDGHEIGVVQASSNEIDARDLVIASVPTVSRTNRLAQIAAQRFDLIVVDEAHHTAADSYKRVLATFPNTPVLGLTATPSRDDKKSLLDVYPEGIAYKYSIRRAVEEGYLVRPVPHRIVLPEFDPNTLATSRVSGDFAQDALAKEMVTEAAVLATLKGIQYAYSQGRKILVFCVSVGQAKLVADRCNKEGMSARSVSCDMGLNARRQAVADHKGDKFQILTNFGILTEGYDDTSIDAVVMARPTQCQELYVQCVGRGLRVHCDCGATRQDPPCSCAKPDCLIVDMVGAHEAHGLVTADTLLEYGPGELHPYAMEDDETQERIEKARLAALEELDMEDSRLRSFLRAVAGKSDLSRQYGEENGQETSIRWACVAQNKCYTLPAGDGSVHVESNGYGEWRAVFEPRSKTEPPHLVCDWGQKDIALTVAEKRVLQNGGRWACNADAPWRQQPASPAQMRALEKWRVHIPKGKLLTKGEAGRLLDIAGARARWRDRQRGKREVVDQQPVNWLAI